MNSSYERNLICILFLWYSLVHAAASSNDQTAASSSSQIDVASQTPRQEFNLQKLIIPSGSYVAAIHPELTAQHEYTPHEVYYNLKSIKFEHHISYFDAEYIGGFTYPIEHRCGPVPFANNVPKLVRLMTYLGDHGMLAFDDNFFRISSAALRAKWIDARDRAIEQQRIACGAPILYRLSPHLLKDIDLHSLPDVDMVTFFYREFQAKQATPVARSSMPNIKLPEDHLLDSVTIQETLQPLLLAMHIKLGQFFYLPKRGIADWKEAEQELHQDIQQICQAESTPWEKIAALRAMFYASSDIKRYHNPAPIAKAYRPTQPTLWGVSHGERRTVNVTYYSPVNGALPELFAREVLRAMSALIVPNGSGQIQAPALTLNDIPEKEFQRLFHYVAADRSLHEKPCAVTNVETFLYNQAIKLLADRVLEVATSSAHNKAFLLDLYKIIKHGEARDATKVRQRHCTQRILNALPEAELLRIRYALMQSLGGDAASIDAIDTTTDEMQAYYKLRAAEQLELIGFLPTCISIYQNHIKPCSLNLDDQASEWVPFIWHFCFLTPENQYEFLMRLWDKDKEIFEVDRFVNKHYCHNSRHATCLRFLDIYRYIAYGIKPGSYVHDHNRSIAYDDIEKLAGNSRDHINLLPEMQEELNFMRIAILLRMYPRYKEILQALHADETSGYENQQRTNEQLCAYISGFNDAQCKLVLRQLLALQNGEDELSLMVQMRPYVLLGTGMQQEIIQTLQQRIEHLSYLQLPQQAAEAQQPQPAIEQQQVVDQQQPPLVQDQVIQQPEVTNMQPVVLQYGVPVLRYVLPFLRFYFFGR